VSTAKLWSPPPTGSVERRVPRHSLAERAAGLLPALRSSSSGASSYQRDSERRWRDSSSGTSLWSASSSRASSRGKHLRPVHRSGQAAITPGTAPGRPDGANWLRS